MPIIDASTIDEVKNRLVKTYDPLAIYIFGSYAWGKPDEDSDLDLLIVVDDFKQSWHQDVVEGHKALHGLKIPKDILVYSKKQFDEASQDSTSFGYKIISKGRKVYAKA